MRLVYLDCAAGLSGDMLLGALLDAGLDRRFLQSRLASLPVRSFRLAFRRVRRASIGALKVNVHVTGAQPHRGWSAIRSIVRRARLAPPVRDAALAVFERLIHVEAGLHRIPMEKVHLHELGAVDAIVDIVGGVAGLHEMAGGLEKGRIVCSPLNVGHGTVRAHHGALPIPAPATAALLRGAPIFSEGSPGERVTPTGAALVATLCGAFGPPPPMVIEQVGYGAGTREDPDRPNVTRLLVGRRWPQETGAGSHDLVLLECTIDDMNPQAYGYLRERLADVGALEVFYTAVQMKKDRPGVMVTALAPIALLQQTARVLFEETTTLGVRYRAVSRIELRRHIETIPTRFGRVRMKVAALEGKVVHAQPEYDDCRRLAARRHIPLKRVQAAASAAWESRA